MPPILQSVPRACRRRPRLFAALLVCAIVVACSRVQTTRPGVIGVEREQTMSSLVSSEELEQGAETAYAQVLSAEREKGNLNADPAMTAKVRRIAQRIIPEVDAFRPDAVGWDWEVNVIESEQLNAWAMPGGKIAFYSGIIEKLGLTEGEIAAIMGHEIAHALREHGRERASERVVSGLLLDGGVIFGSILTGTDLSGLGQTARMAYQVSVGLPNSRLHETEADRVGIELMARAGYDPRGAIRVWQKMAQASGGKGGPKFLSTHPSPDSRIADLTDYARRVMPLYQRADKAPA